MSEIAKDIVRAAVAGDIDVVRLSDFDASAFMSRILGRYGVGAYPWPLWEKADFPVAVQDPLAWTWLAEFIGPSPCNLFFSPFTEPAVFCCGSGMDLNRLLEETLSYEFYVADTDCTFLFSFNHHDFLAAAGAAADWLAGRRS